MAYDANTDYKSLQIALKKQLETEIDPTKKAQLQAQYDSAEQSRLEKMASDLSKYGKYATGAELDSAAGIVAQNQLGTGYEIQKENLNKSFDAARQNASNEALSRGMARSSFVQDRMANLDVARANALSDVDTSRIAAIQKAKTSVLDNYHANEANTLATEKKDFGDNIMAYYNDFQSEINKVQNDNDTTNDWKIPILQAARNEKLMKMYGTTNPQAATTTTTTPVTTSGITTVSEYDRIGKLLSNARASGASVAEIAQGLSDYVKSGALTQEEANRLYSAYVTSRGGR